MYHDRQKELQIKKNLDFLLSHLDYKVSYEDRVKT